MADDRYTLDESRKLAVLIARIWSDPQLEASYNKSPETVLADAGINLAGRAAPQIPDKPAGIDAQELTRAARFSSASSVSTVTCPCTACSAACAEMQAATFERQLSTISKLAEDPGAREQARKLAANWNIVTPPK